MLFSLRPNKTFLDSNYGNSASVDLIEDILKNDLNDEWRQFLVFLVKFDSYFGLLLLQNKQNILTLSVKIKSSFALAAKQARKACIFYQILKLEQLNFIFSDNKHNYIAYLSSIHYLLKSNSWWHHLEEKNYWRIVFLLSLGHYLRSEKLEF
jgi:hypothetical protein